MPKRNHHTKLRIAEDLKNWGFQTNKQFYEFIEDMPENQMQTCVLIKISTELTKINQTLNKIQRAIGQPNKKKVKS